MPTYSGLVKTACKWDLLAKVGAVKTYPTKLTLADLGEDGDIKSVKTPKSVMPVGEGKTTMSAAVPIAIKERFQRIADQKRWTLSQTIVIFAEEYLNHWETELGIEETNAATSSSDSQAKS